MEKKLINVAIDGTSSSGKSTMAKALAKYAGYTYIDTGAMYRAVTLYCLQHCYIKDGKVDVQRLVAAFGDIKISFKLDGGVQHTCLNGVDVEKEIRGLEVSNNVSPVAAVPQVRHELVRQQQELGRGKGVVMDGRDIGTAAIARCWPRARPASPSTRWWPTCACATTSTPPAPRAPCARPRALVSSTALP